MSVSSHRWKVKSEDSHASNHETQVSCYQDVRGSPGDRQRTCPKSISRANYFLERGQATAEFALVLPLCAFVLLVLVQGGVVIRDHVLVVHAARAAAREASVDSGEFRILGAVHRVLPDAVVDVGPHGAVGDPVEVAVRYVSRTDLPLVGPLLPDLTLTASVVMRIER